MKLEEISDEKLEKNIKFLDWFTFFPIGCALLFSIMLFGIFLFPIDINSQVTITLVVGANGMLIGTTAVLYAWLLACKSERRLRKIITSLDVKVESEKK